MSRGGYIVLAGRAKDTIVLSNGENVEPGPIEDACTASSFITSLICWGQDHRMLGALVVPDTEAFDALAKSQGGACECCLDCSRLLACGACWCCP